MAAQEPTPGRPLSEDSPSQPSYMLGRPFLSWDKGRAKTVTFIVTKDCQLRCGYCYLVGKRSHARMDFDVARRSVDYLLGNRKLFADPSIIWEFIGGEPFLEIELIDRIVDYIKRRMYELEHPWFNSYRLCFSTNGLLYGDERVQHFILKNSAHISVGITIDGTQAKHNMQRVYADGRGSYADVVHNIPLWLRQFPGASTKVTVSHDDLSLIKESVLHLWELGLKEVAINLVFEDVWQEGDDLVFEEQLRALADHILAHELWRNYNFSFFQETLGRPLDPVRENQNWCGAGMMLAIDGQGNFLPCVRFADYALMHKKPRIIGNCRDGVDRNKLRAFLALDRFSQSSRECMECPVSNGCAWCQGVNYDFAETGTIYQRATFICKMHKARVRANNYYWDRLRELTGLERPNPNTCCGDEA